MRVGIVGAGIIGSSCALELADRGADVVLLERRDVLFGGSTAAGFGSLTPFSDPFFRGQARDFAVRSVSLYRQEWIPRASAVLGSAIDVGDHGLLDLFVTPEDELNAKRLQSELFAAGYDSRLMDRREVIEIEPQLRGAYAGALWLDEPWLDLQQYLRGLERLLRGHRQVSITHGRSAEILRAEGARISVGDGHGTLGVFDAVLIATGIDGMEGLVPALPRVRRIRGDAVEVTARSGKPLISRHVYRNEAFITPRRDGRMLLGATYHEDESEQLGYRDRDCQTASARAVSSLLLNNSELVPELLECDVTRVWRGWRPAMPDNQPVLGWSRVKNVLVANGFIGLGTTMAPAVAKAAADLILGDRSVIPLEFDPRRFEHLS